MNKKIILAVLISIAGTTVLAGCLEPPCVQYQVPIYETVYDGTIVDTGISDVSWTFSGASDVQKTYTGKDIWGSEEYTISIYYGSSVESFQKINTLIYKSRQVLAGYETRCK